MMVLRDYQEECLRNIVSEYDAGVQRQLVVLATGGGKTVIFSHIPQLFPGKKVLVLAHRKELLTQAYKKLHKANPSLHIDIEKAELFASEWSDIVIASVPTLGKEDSVRRERFDDFDIIIIDEAHHAAAKSYHHILEHYGFPCHEKAVVPPGKLLLGVTATPQRSDKIGLDHVFDRVVYNRSLRDMIDDGYLVDIVPYRLTTNDTLDGIKLRAGDFSEGELAERLNNENRNQLIVNGWMQHAKDKKTIVFCIDVQHTTDVCDLFRNAGVEAEMVVGSTPDDMRTAILRRYEAGVTKVLCGCMVFTEGFDDPGTECILMARPTKSQLVYIQQLGRGMRPFVDLTGLDKPQRLKALADSSKPNMILLDVVDNVTKNSPVMLPTLFGLHKDILMHGKKVNETAREIEKIQDEFPSFRASKVKDVSKLEEMKVEAQKLDPWSAIELPEEVAQFSKLEWFYYDHDYRIHVNDFETIILRQNILDQWDAVVRATHEYKESVDKSNGEITQGWVKLDEPKEEVLGQAPSVDKAFTRTDKWIEENYPDQVNLLRQKASWHDHPASEKQINFLKKHLRTAIREDATGVYWYNGKENVFLTKHLAKKLMSQKLYEWKRKRPAGVS